ncbi:cellulose biosynthesis protein BcsE [Pantoea sp. FN060301]|uniref:cellulose biosynthesis protein BcsE n=1 Tax=Pantoea sp. FN060301 TaxID=3420380 RepID=UPI003D170545
MSDTRKATSAFTLGFGQARQACMRMQPAGCYWVTVNPEEDARLLARQCVSTQRPVALIHSGIGPDVLLSDGPAAVPHIALPETEEALMGLADDPAAILPRSPGVILFFTTSSLWEILSADTRYRWMKKMQAFISGQQSTLLIITATPETNPLRPQLQTFYRYLSGLSHLSRHHDHWDYRISWWTDNEGMLTDRTLRLSLTDGRFTQISQEEEAAPPVPDDAQLYLVEKSVLENSPPDASRWHLFENNAELYGRARQAEAATVVFSLHHSEEIANLASHIHSLRRSRGSALKIVVREKQAALRYSNERLLLACGVNAIVPFTAPVSRLFATLEEIQGHAYNRHVPAELDALLRSTHPLQERGYLPPACFFRSVAGRINNALLPENCKGLLIALDTVPGLSSTEALELCKPRRFGDVVTLAEEKLWLFLSSCRYSDLDTALRFIFRQPHEQMFSHRTVWHKDAEIIGLIREQPGQSDHPQSAPTGEALALRSLPQNHTPDETPPDETS